ncbi:ABC transporter permease [Leptolyngbya sp. FACHB-60]|uniref:ABC transporter permease n=1 Tax=unclassified Leptolyngbya TaxID=2650499 RepID=UPI00168409BD|nr:ABC transporter permease [Phormidium sp. FACHB-77]MBD2032745.1 ABC transporter permease [Phormidium sp. FACHB-322]MBD2049890.1 ABC transporter permease [Leptolyngbya sp. FACHB-60]
MKALWRKKTLIKRWLPLDDTQWAKLNLLKTLVQRDLEARYKGSILGKLWPLLNQVSQLLIYTYVFGVVLQLRLSLAGLPEDNSFVFGLWLFAGLLPWLAFSGGLSQAATSVINQSNLVKKVVFPLTLLPLVPILSSFIESTLGLMALITFVVLATQKLHPTLLLLPLVWLPQLCLTAGLGFLTAGLSVFLRDIPQTLGVILNLWFYATPLIYPANMIPQPFQSWVFWLNPMAAIGELYRDMILTGTVTHWNEWAVATIVSILILLGGFWCYRKLRPAFADVL